MARKTIQQPALRPANLSIGQIKAAITKLKRRLEELQDFNPEAAAQDNSIATALETKIDHALMEIFGSDTTDYKRHKIDSLYSGGGFIMDFGFNEPSLQELTEPYITGKKEAIAKLEAALSIMGEAVQDAEAIPCASKAPLSLDGLDMHPVLASACGALYKDGHFAQAIETACKVLNVQVQTKSGIYTTDNTKLMEFVFSPKNLVLAFNDMQDESDQDEQQGMMSIYRGIFLAFRNPRAHKLVDDDPQTAFGIIRMIDFLIKMLDKAKKK